MVTAPMGNALDALRPLGMPAFSSSSIKMSSSSSCAPAFITDAASQSGSDSGVEDHEKGKCSLIKVSFRILALKCDVTLFRVLSRAPSVFEMIILMNTLSRIDDSANNLRRQYLSISASLCIENTFTFAKRVSKAYTKMHIKSEDIPFSAWGN
jgi:hypothetical protein